LDRLEAVAEREDVITGVVYYDELEGLADKRLEGVLLVPSIGADPIGNGCRSGPHTMLLLPFPDPSGWTR